MPDPSGAESRLALLRRRWEGEHSVSAFLPLAEEFRRIGRVREAIEVLESGLRAFPWHTSAQVALGRCRLESGEEAAAIAALEKIVREDPTHLVANKLLVEAYLRAGKPEAGRERLEIYAALNERDPEIDRLRQRLAGPGAGPPGEIFRLPMPAVPQPDLSDLRVPREPASAFSGVATSTAAAASADPFPGLAGARARRRYLEGLTAEGLFRLRLRAVEPPPRVPPVPPAPAMAAVPLTPPVAGVPPTAPVARPAPAAPVAPEPAPTVTLGELYLRQGHPGEAEGIFAVVLAHEPENRRARSGLEEARAAAAATGSASSRAARQVRALRAYLERLRRGAQHVS